MKTTLKLAAGLGILYLALKVIYRSRKSYKNRSRLITVANEGYETAIDVLFPENKTKGRLQYGPVIPT